MQQINNFSLTPMNDLIAEKTIEDHKYLLELVENRCAISYFAAVNRNQSLYFALKKHDAGMKARGEDENKKKSSEELGLELVFNRMIEDYDFMSIIMYPDL